MIFYFNINKDYREEQYIFRACIKGKNKQTRQKRHGCYKHNY